MFKFILGSQSPRRKEILEFFHLPFEQVPSAFDEDSIPFLGNPQEYVCALSKAKASVIQDRYPDATILTADSIVYQKGKVYGKPKDEEDACRILRELMGQWHSVFTGVTVRQGSSEFHKAEETKVLFNELTDEQIKLYNRSQYWKDKAGGYGIQMGGSLMVRQIHGCFYNVMGLPVNTVRELLLKIGVDLWQYINK